MKNECSVVRDILPLYIENMVSEETGEFISEHIAGCPECAAELETLKNEKAPEKTDSGIGNRLEAEIIKSMKFPYLSEFVYCFTFSPFTVFSRSVL